MQSIYEHKKSILTKESSKALSIENGGAADFSPAYEASVFANSSPVTG